MRFAQSKNKSVTQIIFFFSERRRAMKAYSITLLNVEEAMSCPLYADLQLGIRYAMSFLELEGWIGQAQRACAIGALTRGELDGLLEEAQGVGNELPGV